MGNKASVASGETAAAECARVANAFARTFVRAHGLAVAAELRRQAELDRDGAAAGGSRGDVATQYALELPPVATEPLEAGWLVKLGEIKKSWRRRWFVAAEESDNFVVRYFEKEADAGDARKAKGAIYLAGYMPRALAGDEGFGEHVLCLDPISKRDKRVYYLRCDSEEQRQRWRLVLRLACIKAQPPLAPEPALAEAFKQAYTRARRAAGLCGYFALDRPEQEQLLSLCLEACRAKLRAALGGGDAAGGFLVGELAEAASSSSSAGSTRSRGAAAAAGSSSGGSAASGGASSKEREAV